MSSLRYGVSPHPAQAPGELEQRLEQLRALHRVWATSQRSQLGDGEEEVPVGPLPLEMVGLGAHVDRLVPHLLLADGRADVDADPAPGAVVGHHLDGEQLPGKSVDRNSLVAKPSGAPSSAVGSNTLILIAAWGQTSAHLAQSMQIAGSQIGISWAIDRFSHVPCRWGRCRRPAGRRPAADRPARPSSSPSPAGRSRGRVGHRRPAIVGARTASPARRHWCERGEARRSRPGCARTTTSPRLP